MTIDDSTAPSVVVIGVASSPYHEPDACPPQTAAWAGRAWRPVGAEPHLPQGGGDHADDHRCAGEWLTVAVMAHAVRFLRGAMEYEVPPQDLTLATVADPRDPAQPLRDDAGPPADLTPSTGSEAAGTMSAT